MNQPDEPAVSRGGSRIHRHDEASNWKAPAGEECLEQISDHVRQHLGPVQSVFHELASDTVHIDVHLLDPTPSFPHRRLVTSGMSDLPMAVPAGSCAPRFAELMMTLPADWKLDGEALDDEAWYWPIRLIKTLARLPHKYDTWLGVGHSVPNGDPAVPYARNTRLAGALIIGPPSQPAAFETLRIDAEKTIQFYSVLALYQEEMAFKLRHGTGKLMQEFTRKGLSDLTDPARRNVAKKRFRIF